MGLVKKIIGKTNVPLNYHNISKVSVDSQSRTFSVHVDSYADKTSRTTGAWVVESNVYSFPWKEFQVFDGNLYAFAYSRLKELEVFRGAKDDSTQIWYELDKVRAEEVTKVQGATADLLKEIDAEKTQVDS